MDYAKYIKHLEATFDKSFTFSKEVALKRDNKLIEGFLNKAEEELSFNDFYSNGNENVIRYVAVLHGLKEKKYTFFENMSQEMITKFSVINQATAKMLKEREEYNALYNVFKMGAEYCLYIYIDEVLSYNNLDNRLQFQNILKRVRGLANKSIITTKDKLELKNLINEGQMMINSIKFLNKKLESENFVKRNAFYAVKKFSWLHENGALERMTKLEMKSFYFRKVREEMKNKHQLLQSEFINKKGKINIFA